MSTATNPSPAPEPSHSLGTLELGRRLWIRGVLGGLFALAVLVAGVAFGYSRWRTNEARQHRLFVDITEARTRLALQESKLALIKKDEVRLRVSSERLVNRINQLANELRLTPDVVQPNVPASSLVVSRPMLDQSTGLRLVISGPPEQLHRFFAAIETEMPALTVMETSVSRIRDRLEVGTTYLLPVYATF
jgi:hypothetical protein